MNALNNMNYALLKEHSEFALYLQKSLVIYYRVDFVFITAWQTIRLVL